MSPGSCLETISMSAHFFFGSFVFWSILAQLKVKLYSKKRPRWCLPDTALSGLFVSSCMSRDETSREATVHSALRLPLSSSLASARVPSICCESDCSWTRVSRAQWHTCCSPCSRASSCWGLAAGQRRGQLPGQPDLRRHEAARVNSSAHGASSSRSATVLVGCADPCCHHAAALRSQEGEMPVRESGPGLWLEVWLLESSSSMVLGVFRDTDLTFRRYPGPAQGWPRSP